MTSEFWKRLITAFERRGLGTKQMEIAKTLGVAQPSVWQWKVGRNYPSHTTLVKIGKVTGVSVEWLYSGRGAMIPPDSISSEKQALIDKIENLPAEQYKIALQILAALDSGQE